MDPLALTLLLVVYFASLNCIWVVARRVERASTARLSRQLTYTCACTHAFGLHFNGQCTGKVREPISWHSAGYEINWQLVPCRCRCYAGDVPPEYVLGSFPQQLNVGDGRVGDDEAGAGGGTRHRR